jgi:hypothetical protein
MLKIYILLSYVYCNLIWPNLPMDHRHFGDLTKLTKTTLAPARAGWRAQEGYLRTYRHCFIVFVLIVRTLDEWAMAETLITSARNSHNASPID